MTEQPTDPEFARWRWEQDRQIAERYHDRDIEMMQNANDAAINNANAALRALLIINGGAAVTVLAFVGTIISADSDSLMDDLSALTLPIMWFAWGVALTALGMGFAYFTNYCGAASVSHRSFMWEHPYTDDTDESRLWRRFAYGFQIVAALLAFWSLGCFLTGMYQIRAAVSALA